MLFRKKIEHSCSYCQHGAVLESNCVLCAKKGLRPEGKPCWKFRYDPCKRIPPKPKALDFSEFNEHDFSL